MPSLPTRTLLGSNILQTNPPLSIADRLVHVDAVRPDVAIVHVQRADDMGRAHAWGPLGITEEAGLAAERVVLTCEQLVEAHVTLSDPNRILFPETKVVAVVHEPGGAHPSPVQGYFRRDHAFGLGPGVAAVVRETSAPTESELAAIRKLDPEGFWRVTKA